MKKILAVIFGLSLAIQAAQLQSIDAETLVKMQKAGVPVIDIRTPGEWKRGVIPGAHLMMFFDERGRPHIEEWMKKLKTLVPSKEAPFILYCAHANRTKALGNWLVEKMGFKKVYELKGGFEYGWKDVGRQVAISD